jgi:hypothetical protein
LGQVNSIPGQAMYWLGELLTSCKCITGHNQKALKDE